ncbi:hypothetical protein EFY87_00015 [Flexivirga caeni]|uniref:Uncharacterized protein n=1 Tax=Flexivirga caeni TaxID=2294115 RepID=A0A3M9MHR9_9MICO|nr:hypothetical protein EFY87_00015 [Flexivirga caeni]
MDSADEKAHAAVRFVYYQVRADAGEPVGSTIRVPSGSMDCYRWGPDSSDWVYDEGLSGEIGYPMTEIVFEEITPQEAATLTGSRDGEALG